MTPRPNSRYRLLLRACLLALSASVAFPLAPTVRAADGTWNTTTTGLNWSTSGNWAGGTVADGSGSTAYFDTLNITAQTSVTLDSSRTLGNLVFGDTNSATPAVWVITNGGTSTRILTLAGATPTITNNVLGETSRAAINLEIAGASGLTKAGVGTISLGNANSYTGGTFINAGRLRARNSAAFSSGTVTVASGAGMELDNGVTVANTINLNGTSALTNNAGSNILSGTVNLQSASTATMTAGSLNISGSLNLGSNQLDVLGTTTLTVSGAISGSGTFNLAGTGGLILTNDNSGTYSGQTNIGRNTLVIGHNGALGSGTVQMGVNDQQSGIRSTDTTTRTIANVFTLAGNNNTGSNYLFGSLTAGLNGNLTFTNTTAIALGTTKKFQVQNRTQFDAGFVGSGSGITMQTGTGTLVLNGANTYTGATTINAGTLQLGTGGTSGSLSTSSAISVASGATFAVNRSNAVAQGVDFTGGAITGAGSFTQAGSGTTVLLGNSFTGAINVSAGTLLINGANTSASGVGVAPGARLGGVGGSVGAVTFNTGAALAYNIASAAQTGGLTTTGFTGTGVGSFTLYLTGAATGFDDAQNYSWAVLSSNSTDIGSVTLSGITLDTSGFGQEFTGAFNLTKDASSIYVNYVAAVIPEPATYAALAGLGVLVLAACRRRRA